MTENNNDSSDKNRGGVDLNESIRQWLLMSDSVRDELQCNPPPTPKPSNYNPPDVTMTKLLDAFVQQELELRSLRAENNLLNQRVRVLHEQLSVVLSEANDLLETMRDSLNGRQA